MSWRATAWAVKQKTGNPGAKVTLLALANCANADGLAWPSQQTLAGDTEQSIDTVQRQLRALEASGFISIERKRDRGRWPKLVYRLNLKANWTKPQNAVGTRPQNAARTMPHQARHHAAPGPSTVPHSCAALTLIEPSNERLEPQEVNKGEEEPSEDQVKNYIRQRKEEERNLAAKRKQRESVDEIKKRYGPNYGLKTMPD